MMVILRSISLVITEAEDGDEAVALLDESLRAGAAFDLVLLDSVMVRMHGPAAVQVMRRDLGYRGTVIAVTGNALPEDVRNFMEHGVDVVLTKPLDKGKLLDFLRQQKFWTE